MKIKINQFQIESFVDIIQNSHSVVIVPHIGPDGDAIGSCLALRSLLKNLNKEANIIIPNEFPDFLQWIEGSDSVIDFEKQSKVAKGIFASADTLFCLDFNDFERAGDLKNLLSAFSGRKVMIDHHPGPVAKCDLLISYPEICSTCELLFRVIEAGGLLGCLDKAACDAIYTGIMTDTGNFSYNASDPETYHIIAKLLERGIDKDLIHSNIYHTFSEDRWRLFGHTLKEKMVILHEFRTGYMCLSKEELAQFHYQPGDTEGLVNYPLMVKGIVFCALFIEKDDYVKASFRSKGSFSTNEFSKKHFKGGGHTNASGGSSDLSLKDTVAKFESLLIENKDELLNSY
jgi:phosphoesterase RecJ-like protein